MAWVAPVIQGVGALFGASESKKAAKKADQRLQEGRDYAINKSGLSDFAKTGAAAGNQQAALLGVGGDPAAAEEGFQNYLNSTGYKFNLQQGQNAVATSAAAKGLLNSGATAKALTKFGQNIGSNYFNNYQSQLGGVAGRGLQASDSLARTVTGVGGQQAQVAQQAGQDMSGQINNAFGNVADYAAYQYGQRPPPAVAGGAPTVGGNVSNVFGSGVASNGARR